VESIDAYPGFDLKKIFAEWNIIFKLKVPLKLFGFKDEFFLEKIHQQERHCDVGNDIPDKAGQ
jgi:hypothetical protein